MKVNKESVMNAKAKVSIIVATYNRAVLLGETLQSLAHHLATENINADVEVIVVDNNSSDDTTAVANIFKPRFADLKVLFESKQGLSPARNAGLAVANGEFIVFLDDDVELETNWLNALLCEFTDPKISVVGGKVLAFGNRTLPDWLPHEYAYLVSVFDPSDVVVDLPTVMGGNSAVRRSVFETTGMFNPTLGRRGNKLLGGEEVEFYRRISATGGRIVYTPYATILHKIDNKIRKDYVIDYAYWLGMSEAHIDRNIVSYTKFALKYARSAVFPYFVYPLQRHFWDPKVAEIKFAIKKRYALGYLDYKNALTG